MRSHASRVPSIAIFNSPNDAMAFQQKNNGLAIPKRYAGEAITVRRHAQKISNSPVAGNESRMSVGAQILCVSKTASGDEFGFGW
jgi:hypothetical protein